MSLNKHTREYDGGSPDVPLATGDVFRSHDLCRDLEYLQERAGRIAFDLFDLSAVLLKGGVVSKGTGDTLDITPAVAYIPHQVKTPDSYAGNPPTVKNEDSIRRVASTQQTNMAIAGATLDGSTPNYVKLRAKETDGSSRARLKGSGSYAYERVDSFEFVVTSVAGGTYDLVLASFTGTPSGAFTFSNQKTPDITDLARLLLDDVTERDARETIGVGVNWLSARLVGAGFSIAGTTYPTLTALTETDVAFFSHGIGELRTYRFNGASWSIVGSGLAIAGTVNVASLAAVNETDVAFLAESIDELRMYRFNGSTWSLVGSGLSIPTSSLANLTALTGTDVALVDSGLGELRTYRFSGSAWSQVGSGLAISGLGTTKKLTALNATDVAFADEGNEELRTYRFDGSTWAQVGNSFALDAWTNATGLAALNETDVVFIDDTATLLYIYRFDGSSWSLVSLPTNISGAGVNFGITAMNGTDIAWIDASLDELRVYRFDFSFSGMQPYHP